MYDPPTDRSPNVARRGVGGAKVGFFSEAAKSLGGKSKEFGKKKATLFISKGKLYKTRRENLNYRSVSISAQSACISTLMHAFSIANSVHSIRGARMP